MIAAGLSIVILGVLQLLGTNVLALFNSIVAGLG